MAETKAASAQKPVDPRVEQAEAEAQRVREQAEAERQDNLRAIKEREEDEPSGEKVPGMWVQYVNPNREDPDFESMDGYTFERNGDAIMVKLPQGRMDKFRNNRNFRVVEEVDDASGIPDGDTKAAPAEHRTRAKPRVGKTG